MRSTRSWPAVWAVALLALVLAAPLTGSLARLAGPDAGGSGSDALTGAGAGVYLPFQVHPRRSRDIHVMIMTHNRPASVEQLIEQVIELAKLRNHRLHVVVSQSASSSSAGNVRSLRATLAGLRAKHGTEGGLRSLAHVVAPYIRTDTSFSVNRDAHGSKRNSVYNMLVGLDIAFTGRHAPPAFPRSTDAAGASKAGAGGDFAATVAAEMDEAAKEESGYSAVNELEAYRKNLQASGFLSFVQREAQEHSASVPEAPQLDNDSGKAAVHNADTPASNRGYSGHPFVITLEDDVKLSADALDYFAFAGDLMASEQTDAAAGLAAIAGGRKDGQEAVPAAAPYAEAVTRKGLGDGGAGSGSRDASSNNSGGGSSSSGAEQEPVTPLNDGALHFATAYSLFRPSLLVGQDDVAFVRSRHDGQGIAETVVDRLLGSPRSVFKTLAWSCDAIGYAKLRALLASIASYEPSPWRRRVESGVREAHEVASALRAKAGAGFLGSDMEALLDEISSSARFMAFRSGHPEFARSPSSSSDNANAGVAWACWWCNDYCYDHAIEWTLQRQPFLAPMVPRVTQRKGSGMTSVANDENELYRGRPPLDKNNNGNGAVEGAVEGKAEAVAEALAIAAVPPHELAEQYGYHLREWPLYWTTSLLFRTPGLSAMSPPLPPPPHDGSGSQSADGGDGSGDNAEKPASPVLQLERTVRALKQRAGLAEGASSSAPAATSFSGAASLPDEFVIRPLLEQTLASLGEISALPSTDVFVLYARERVLLFGVLPLVLILSLVLLSKVVVPSVALFLERRRLQELINDSKRRAAAATSSQGAGALMTSGAGGGRRGSFGHGAGSSFMAESAAAGRKVALSASGMTDKED